MYEREPRWNKVRLDETWYRNNDLNPAVIVHQTPEEALADISSTIKEYPIIESNPKHPLGIDLYQDETILKELERRGIHRGPSRTIFCSTKELRNNVLGILVNKMGEPQKYGSPIKLEE